MREVVAGSVALLLSLVLSMALFSGADGPALAAAGEAGPEPDLPAVLAPVDAEEARLHGVPRPRWSVGDAWSVTFFPSGYACRLVVVEAHPEGYRQGAACRNARSAAAEDAVFDYAFMGDIGLGLDGAQAGGSVAFFSWPLVDGKRWETEWWGLPVVVEATFDPAVEGPRGEEPGFRLRMVGEGGRLADYDYVPSIGWWSHLRMRGGFEMRVDAFEAGWRGEALRAEAAPRLQLGAGSATGNARGSFEAPPEDDLLLMVHRTSGLNVQHVRVTAPSGQTAYERTTLPLLEGSGLRMGYLDAEPGVWTVEAPRVGLGASDVQVHGLRLLRHEV